MIGLFGGSLGLVLAWLISFPGDTWVRSMVHRDMNIELSGSIFAFPGWIGGTVLVFTVGVTIVAGVYPSRRAARLDPVSAIRARLIGPARPGLIHGSRITLLWKKPADSGLPGSWRNVSPSMRNLYSCDPGAERDRRRVVPPGVRTGHGQRPFLPVGEGADDGDRFRWRFRAVLEADFVLAVRESLRGGHAEGEVLVGEGEVEVSDVHFIARCSPNVTARLGSGLFGFSAELSNLASVWRIVPSGIGLGRSRTYRFCQSNSYRGTSRMTSRRPSGYIGDEPHRLAPQVHVRQQRDQQRGLRESEISPRDVVARSGWDLEAEVERHARHQLFVDCRRLGE